MDPLSQAILTSLTAAVGAEAGGLGLAMDDDVWNGVKAKFVHLTQLDKIKRAGAFEGKGFLAVSACDRLGMPGCDLSGGKQSVSWNELYDTRSSPTYAVKFARRDCGACASHAKCTKAKQAPRQLTLEAHELYLLTQAVRQRQQTEEFKAEYALRSGIESLISEGVRACDLRPSRYRGQARTHLQHILTAVAANLIRLVVWLRDRQPMLQHSSAFLRLVAST